MRRLNILLFASLIFISAASCTCIGNRNAAATQQVQDKEEVASAITAVNLYLSETIAKEYSPGEVSIPYFDYISVDETNPEDILVWGDFWVDNYNVSGDTLLCVSGGNHPGRMHVRKEPDGSFQVTSFDQVANGSMFIPTAKEIFGERFKDFQAAQSNDTKRAEIRKNAVASHVFKHKLPVTLYKDYGWPAVEIPKVNATEEYK